MKATGTTLVALLVCLSAQGAERLKLDLSEVPVSAQVNPPGSMAVPLYPPTFQAEYERAFRTYRDIESVVKSGGWTGAFRVDVAHGTSGLDGIVTHDRFVFLFDTAAARDGGVAKLRGRFVAWSVNNAGLHAESTVDLSGPETAALLAAIDQAEFFSLPPFPADSRTGLSGWRFALDDLKLGTEKRTEVAGEEFRDGKRTFVIRRAEASEPARALAFWLQSFRAKPFRYVPRLN